MTLPSKVRQVVLAARPAGKVAASDFRLETVDAPAVGEGEIMTRTLWLSVDPYMRLSLGEGGQALGSLMNGGTVSEVVASSNPAFKVGDIVEGRTGWRDYAVSNGQGMTRVDPSLGPITTALGVLGMPGLTAHTGMVPVGKVKAEDTVVVSSAGGAVGSIAGQIGKAVGARVVGIAGGAKKCAEVEALGFDACVDYQAADFAEKLKAACPNGADLYFDNVGAAVSQVVFQQLNLEARVSVCGFIGWSDLSDAAPGPNQLPALYKTIVMKRLRITGFTGANKAADAMQQLAGWVKDGKIAHPERVYEGLDQAPQAFTDMLGGRAGTGKVVIRVGPA